jgi:hypothetical protein
MPRATDLILLVPPLFGIAGGLLSSRALHHLSPEGRERLRGRGGVFGRPVARAFHVRENFSAHGWRLRNWALTALALGALGVVAIFVGFDL